MRNFGALLLVCLLVAVLSGCVEEIAPGSNMKPKVWFLRSPRDNQIVRQNRFEFEWMATDYDDDLGMGKTYVMIEPSVVDTLQFHPGGWVRVYRQNNQNLHEVIDMPDTDYVFRVKVVDGRGAVGGDSVHFLVRFDNIPPVIDNVACPVKPPSIPQYPWTFVIEAHDEARSPRSATPAESLRFWYRFGGVSGPATSFQVLEADDYTVENRTLDVMLNGQGQYGVYRYRAKALDWAGNFSAEYRCDFEIKKPGQ